MTGKKILKFGLLGTGWSLVLFLCFYLTRDGVQSWDLFEHYMHARWLFDWLGLEAFPSYFSPPNSVVKHYGPFWEVVLAFFSEFGFAFLREPAWVWNAMTLFSFPASLYLLFKWLKKAGIETFTALLSLSMLPAFIRLGGHALMNYKDFPAAMAYLLVIVFQYNWIKKESKSRRFSIPSLAILGAFSLLPALIRTSMFLQWLVSLCLPLIICYHQKIKTSWRHVLVPFLSGSFLIFLCFLPLYDEGLLQFLTAPFSFMHYQAAHHWPVQIFGTEYASEDLPFWYPFVWILVGFHPLLFLLTLAGLGFLTFRFRPKSLASWMLLFFILPVISIWVTKPILYNEERHILFLYPPLILGAGLALGEHLKETLKKGLIFLLIACSVYSYSFWTRYSYIYLSPLVGEQSVDRFNGDYWALSIPLVVRKTKDLLPANAPVFLRIAPTNVYIEADRLTNSLLHQEPGYQRLQWISSEDGLSPGQTYYKIEANKHDAQKQILKDIEAGKAKLIFKTDLPTGEPGGVLAQYTK
ncbi:MAG: hypothetical protein HYX41_04695 [Bdellovibrio sp.]|nr:hypothetical protein [Bdellovibrio sp.]